MKQIIIAGKMEKKSKIKEGERIKTKLISRIEKERKRKYKKKSLKKRENIKVRFKR